MAHDIVPVTLWASAALVTGHVTAQMSGCGPACLLSRLGGMWGGQSFLSSRVQLGIKWADWVAWSLSLPLPQFARSGRAEGKWGGWAWCPENYRGTSLFLEVGGRWGIGHGSRGLYALDPQFNLSLGHSLELARPGDAHPVLSLRTLPYLQTRRRCPRSG